METDRPASHLLVRPATPADASAIAGIYNQGIEERVSTFETDLRSPQQIRDLLADVSHPQVVVERDGEVIAWAGAGLYRPRRCYAGIAEFSVYTERASRGTGAGRAALQGLITACAGAGFWKLVSRIFPENTASLSLCRSLGFRAVGMYHRHAQLDGIWRDVVIVEKFIGEG